MLPGDRLVCTFVEKQEVGLQFKTWLLHVTIVPWFRLPDESRAIATGLEQALTTVQPFEVAGDGEANFGPGKNRPVRLLQQPTPFTEIELKTRNYLHKKRAWLVDDTTKTQQEFRPHVTVQEEKKLEQGEIFHCDRLYIVEQKGAYKEITAEVLLYKQVGVGKDSRSNARSRP